MEPVTFIDPLKTKEPASALPIPKPGPVAVLPPDRRRLFSFLPRAVNARRWDSSTTSSWQRNNIPAP